MVESWLRPATEGPRRSRAPPRSRQGSAAEKPLLRIRRDRRRDPKNRAEHPTRSSNCAWPRDALSGRLQRTEETFQRNSAAPVIAHRSEEHTSELQSHSDLVCRLLLEKKKYEDNGKEDHRAQTEKAYSIKPYTR